MSVSQMREAQNWQEIVPISQNREEFVTGTNSYIHMLDATDDLPI